MIDIIVNYLGEAPNDEILFLYYVLAIIFIIYFLKVFIMVIRSLFGVGHSHRL